jgi:hypothetical protein
LTTRRFPYGRRQRSYARPPSTDPPCAPTRGASRLPGHRMPLASVLSPERAPSNGAPFRPLFGSGVAALGSRRLDQRVTAGIDTGLCLLAAVCCCPVPTSRMRGGVPPSKLPKEAQPVKSEPPKRVNVDDHAQPCITIHPPPPGHTGSSVPSHMHSSAPVRMTSTYATEVRCCLPGDSLGNPRIRWSAAGLTGMSTMPGSPRASPGPTRGC